MNATLYFHCGDCLEETSFPGIVAIGENRTDVTCTHCGARSHVMYVIQSLDPLIVTDWEMRRPLGIIKDGHFFSNGQLS